MANLIRCKSCGYVTEEGKVKDVCPACGVPSKMFEPYTDPVSPQRRMLLKLDIHPIMVHFAVAFTASLLVLHIASIFIRGGLLDNIYAAVKLLALFLPLTVITAFLAGLFDGKIRFRKITTPLLRTKIFLSAFFFLLSLSILFLLINYGVACLMTPGLLTAALAVALAVVIKLALIGTSLLEAKFPG